MSQEKKVYVLIKSNSGHDLRGYDEFLAPWETYTELVDEVMDQAIHGEEMTFSFVVLQMTDEEHASYCKEHEIEW